MKTKKTSRAAVILALARNRGEIEADALGKMLASVMEPHARDGLNSSIPGPTAGSAGLGAPFRPAEQ